MRKSPWFLSVQYALVLTVCSRCSANDCDHEGAHEGKTWRSPGVGWKPWLMVLQLPELEDSVRSGRL